MIENTVIGGGVFLPPGHWCEEHILKKFELQNPEYKMALGMRQNGQVRTSAQPIHQRMSQDSV